ncbi:RING-H2 finger protein ATL46-like [Zingiber officinale]|nr:RING-H2 finger protein ATL46-like [Zingiber officinale]XP_042376298.1 RING-H2 finger protein ATL46-like [Zingiber officinale]
MVNSICKSLRAPWLLSPARHQSSHLASFLKDSIPISQSQTSSTPTPAPPGSRISPAVLFIIVILAVVFFISGLLHLLVRYLIKKHPFSTSPDPARRRSGEFQGPDAIQRQLQQLFDLHDSGLDQVLIDALPVFLYKEIVGSKEIAGSKEPFDCAVCLCEFAQEEKLRLLPTCSHAFHINCIDTWLLSNSTCPLCRGALFLPSFSIEYPLLDFEDLREEGGFSRDLGVEGHDTVLEKRVFSVRLGKFKNLCANANGAAKDEDSGAPSGAVRMEEGETSSNNLDARRCFSMGYYQYVVADSDLEVTLDSTRIKNGDLRVARGRAANEQHSTSTDAMEGKRLRIGSQGESFSVSKIWQWSKKNGKFPVSSGNTSPVGDLAWVSRNAAEQ